MVRRGLRQLLEAEPSIEVVAEAANLTDGRLYLLGHHPGVLVLDLNLREGLSLNSVPALRSDFPDIRIVVLTMQYEPAYARSALSAGALGYVLKEAAEAELVDAVHRAARGEAYLNPKLGAKVAAEPPAGAPVDGLTQREVEVLRLIALGYTNAEIGKKLFLSVRTVETHRAHVQSKLPVSTRAELVRYALEHGFMGS